MFILILIACAVIVVLGVYIKRLLDKMIQMSKDYEALDQGMVELSDAYESDSLQYEETIEALNVEKTRFSENNSTLLHNARIDRIARHEQEKTIHQLREEVAGVKRQLDIAQTIISEHDLNCLPHIVFDRFKTPDGQISLFQDFDVESDRFVFKGTIDRKDLV